MANNEYSFTTEWRFQARAEEVTAILGDGASLGRWWPSVYLAVQELEPGDERGIGKLVDLHTKGWLPYTLRWRLKVVEIRDDGFTIEASGDFDGRGDWYFTQQGPETIVRYDWNIRAEKPLLRYLSPVLKPIFAANHHWAMAQGQRSLELELARRRALTDAERAAIPPPPGASSAWLPLLIVAPAVVVAAIGWLRWRAVSRRGRLLGQDLTVADGDATLAAGAG